MIINEKETIKNTRVSLIFPTIDHKNKALEYRQEHFDIGEMTIHGDGGLDEAENYEQWIEKINDDLKRDSDGLVPATTFFAFDGEKLVGTIQIRHKLNDYLFNYGGHIGFGVAPTEQKKGYGTEMLQLAIKLCKDFEIERVLITCDKNNIPSARTILKNNGVLENEVIYKDGRVFQRYWIEIG